MGVGGGIGIGIGFGTNRERKPIPGLVASHDSTSRYRWRPRSRHQGTEPSDRFLRLLEL